MGDGSASQPEAWLRLNAAGLSPKLQLALLDAFGSPEAVASLRDRLASGSDLTEALGAL